MGKRFTYEEVYNYFKEQGCELLSNEYKNNKQKLEFICKCGNRDKKDFKEFKKHPFCKKCSKVPRYTYEEVKRYFKENGCVLLSETYVNNRQLLKYQCSCGNISFIRFDSFKRGTRCKQCGYKKVRETQNYSYEEVYNIFQENNCLLLTKEYINNKQKLEYICNCGNKSTITLDAFLRGVRCKECGIKKYSEARKHDYEYVKSIFEEKGCKLLSTEYINIHSKLHYICKCGNENWITLADFMNGHDCRHCGNRKISIFNKTQRKYISGEEHPNWDHSKSKEEREKNRWLHEQKIWRKIIYERDNYTCQRCGDDRGGNLVAHHINSYDWCKDERWNIDNGITLCNKCHKEFHGIYGYGGNTRKQFEEFMTGVAWDCKTKLLQNVI